MLLIRVFLILTIISLSAHSQINSNNEINNEIVIFQFVEQSFFELWLNWWSIAKNVGVFREGNYSLHLSCYGDSLFFDEMKMFTPSGCTDKILVSENPQFKGRIYYAKWHSFTTAFITTKKNMLLCDIDAVFIRDPRSILFDKRDSSIMAYDIIASRDHGHGSADFPYSSNWGTARLCTGFIYFRYSTYTDSLIKLVLRRLKKYGQGDQISFNNILAQSGVIWHSNVSFMDDDKYVHRGELLWYNQHSIDWVSPFANKNQISSLNLVNTSDSIIPAPVPTPAVQRLQIKLLNRHQVLRYCNKPVKRDEILSVLFSGGAPLTNRAVALHCFHPKAYGLGEQGSVKSLSKKQFMSQMMIWVLKANPLVIMDEYASSVPGALKKINAHSRQKSKTSVDTNYRSGHIKFNQTQNQVDSKSNISILTLIQTSGVPFIWELIRDRNQMTRLLDTWIFRDHTRDNELLSPLE